MSDYSYKDQWEILKIIKLKEGDALRLDCPFCAGVNSFGISRNGGVVSWGCFKASCQCHGKKDIGYSREGLSYRLKYDPSIRSTMGEDKHPIPSPLVPIDNNVAILNWLREVNSFIAYNEGLVDIKYSPTEDRVMFKIPDKLGYTGRALASFKGSSFYGPKWKKYGDTSSIFSCGNGEIGVIVEDAPSACAVGAVNGLTGIALLGTKLTTQHKVDLRKYKNLIVCLDPDAAKTSIAFAGRLQGTSNVSVKLIKDDLKYFKPDQIQGMLLAL